MVTIVYNQVEKGTYFKQIKLIYYISCKSLVYMGDLNKMNTPLSLYQDTYQIFPVSFVTHAWMLVSKSTGELCGIPESLD